MASNVPPLPDRYEAGAAAEGHENALREFLSDRGRYPELGDFLEEERRAERLDDPEADTPATPVGGGFLDDEPLPELPGAYSADEDGESCFLAGHIDDPVVCRRLIANQPETQQLTEVELDAAAAGAALGWMRRHLCAADTGLELAGHDEPYNCTEDSPCWYDGYLHTCARGDPGSIPFTIISLTA